ncbi:MAG: tRNA-binding protein [Planctomycetaceae bacterium]|nr:tRNA-binding protein [Planctomycetaceae bacterium]
MELPERPATTIEPEAFFAVELRVGTVRSAALNPAARVPAYVLEVDFGPELGLRTSSAQLTANYRPEDLLGRQVVAVFNLPPKRVAGVKSEILVLGALDPARGTVLLRTDTPVQDGARVA